MQREAREDLAIGPAAQALHEIALLRDLVGIADDPFERAKLHGRQRIVDRRERTLAVQPPAHARPESVSRRRGQRGLALQLRRASIARGRVVMQAVQVGVEDRPCDVAKQIVFVILQHRLQRVALEENAALELAEPRAGGSRRLANGRARLIQNAMAGEPRTPSEVDVLEIGEVVVVEAAQGHKRLAARNHVAAAREEELIAAQGLAARSDRISKSVLKRVAVERHDTADEVDQLSGHVDDFSADGNHVVGSLVDRVDERRQPAGLGNGVVVEEYDVARLRPRDSGGDATGETVVFSEGQEPYVGKTFDDRADAAVSRSIVDNRDGRPLDVGRLRRNCFQTCQRVFAAVPVDDDDVDCDQDAPPMRRFSRSRIEAGRSGTCMRIAKASLFGSTRGSRQNARRAFKASGH